MKRFVRRSIVVLAGFALLAGLGYGFMPPSVQVDLAPVERGKVVVTVDEDGKTRIRERYVVSAPLAGRLLRIEMEPGDAVFSGETLLATLEPRDPDLLDARTVLQAEASVKAAQAKLERTAPLLEESLANQEFAEKELERLREMHASAPRSVSASQLDAATTNWRTRTAMVRSAQHAEEIARFELQQAQAVLGRARPEERYAVRGDKPPVAPTADQHFSIIAPIDGRVLRVFQESAAMVAPGAQLLELGDPDDLEVEIDVLSRDAIRIRPGAAVIFEHWGGEEPLKGHVRLVEPSAFTKISTLGVEEQRVNVIADLENPPEQRTALGDAFRVEARIVVAEVDNVLKIPSSALFRVGDAWGVFCCVQERAALRQVVVGLQNGVEAEIREGLAEEDRVVVHPGDDVVEGVPLIPR